MGKGTVARFVEVLVINFMIQGLDPNHRSSDRVHGCETAQFSQTHTIMHNPRKFANPAQ